MRILPLFMLFFFSLSLFAQDEKIDEYNRNLEDLTIPKKGPNKSKYTHAFLAYGFIIGPSEGDSSSLKYGNSSTFSVGFRNKYRLSKIYELGFDFSYLRTRFLPVQDSSKNVPNGELHDKEMLAINSLELLVFNRFKFKNKEHSAGIFLDLGAYANWNYRTVHYTRNENRKPGSKETLVKDYHLDYMTDYAYGVSARIGFNRFAIDVRYRLSEVFEGNNNYGEFPNMTIGLQLGLHQ
jgi:hypothetical protein